MTKERNWEHIEPQEALHLVRTMSWKRLDWKNFSGLLKQARLFLSLVNSIFRTWKSGIVRLKERNRWKGPKPRSWSDIRNSKIGKEPQPPTLVFHTHTYTHSHTHTHTYTHSRTNTHLHSYTHTHLHTHTHTYTHACCSYCSPLRHVVNTPLSLK